MYPILYWNDVALEADRVSHTNGEGEQTGLTLSSRALAHAPCHVRRFRRSVPCCPHPLSDPQAGIRVYLNVHWVFDAFGVDSNDALDLGQNVGGVPLGLRIANDIFGDGMNRSMVPPRA